MPKAKPIPDGFHTLTPHLVMKDAGKAIEFYKKAFGAEELGRHPGPDGKSIMHALLKIGDSMLMLNDECPEMGARGPLSIGGTAVTMHVYVQDVDKAFERATKAGAKVVMPLADQFWGDRYGIVTDPFGHQWSLATHLQDLTDEQVGKAAQAAFANAPKAKAKK
jgi:PhnB protein